MNTREDLLKWLDDNRAFKDPERKTLSSNIVRTLNKNENIKEDFKKVTKLDSDNSSELIYNIVFPNQARACEVCGKPVKFSAYYLGYKKTCSLSCAGKIANQKGAPVKLEKQCIQRFDCERYLFVVDRTECFKDNIVEEIDNSSHLGRGKEYVVLIRKEQYS